MVSGQSHVYILTILNALLFIDIPQFINTDQHFVYQYTTFVDKTARVSKKNLNKTLTKGSLS